MIIIISYIFYLKKPNKTKKNKQGICAIDVASFSTWILAFRSLLHQRCCGNLSLFYLFLFCYSIFRIILHVSSLLLYFIHQSSSIINHHHQSSSSSLFITHHSSQVIKFLFQLPLFCVSDVLREYSLQPNPDCTAGSYYCYYYCCYYCYYRYDIFFDSFFYVANHQ